MERKEACGGRIWAGHGWVTKVNADFDGNENGRFSVLLFVFLFAFVYRRCDIHTDHLHVSR